MTLLSVERLEARYGQLQAVRGVSLSIDTGETVALVGANGAGKTTLLRTIAGAHRIAAGAVAFKGEDISGKSAHARAALGVALVPEGRRLFAAPDGRGKPPARALCRADGGLDARRRHGGFSQSQGSPALRLLAHCRAASSRPPRSGAP